MDKQLITNHEFQPSQAYPGFEVCKFCGIRRNELDLVNLTCPKRPMTKEKENRAIKFRAWDWTHGVMIDDLALIQLGSHPLVKTAVCAEIVKINIDKCSLVFNPGYNLEVMQSVGLHDKSGKEIFEGDAVSRHVDGIHAEVVRWDSEHASFDPFQHADGLEMPADQCLVIGNIYENPELFKWKRK